MSSETLAEMICRWNPELEHESQELAAELREFLRFYDPELFFLCMEESNDAPV